MIKIKIMDDVFIVFEHSFGEETYGKIEYNTNTQKYQCYETPQYGGEYEKIGEGFDDLTNAKLFLLGMV
jgi:hypothetical protein